jgi:hypothetical protein
MLRWVDRKDARSGMEVEDLSCGPEEETGPVELVVRPLARFRFCKVGMYGSLSRKFWGLSSFGGVRGAVLASGDEGGFQALSEGSKGDAAVLRRPGLEERVGEGEGEVDRDKVLSLLGLRCSFKRFDFLRSGK